MKISNSVCYLNSKIKKIAVFGAKIQMIILANLFSSLFSHYVKRREESKVQDAGNKFLSTATLLCCVGYLIMLELALAKNIHLRLQLKNGIMQITLTICHFKKVNNPLELKW